MGEPKENPWWTLCRKVLGREPTALLYSQWMMSQWDAFHVEMQHNGGSRSPASSRYPCWECCDNEAFDKWLGEKFQNI